MGSNGVNQNLMPSTEFDRICTFIVFSRRQRVKNLDKKFRRYTFFILSGSPPGPSGLLNMSVLTAAGLTQFTRMPRGPTARGKKEYIILRFKHMRLSTDHVEGVLQYSALNEIEYFINIYLYLNGFFAAQNHKNCANLHDDDSLLLSTW